MKGNKNSKLSTVDYTAAAVAEDISLANEYAEILAAHGITAIVSDEHRDGSVSQAGFAVMVPACDLEDACEIIGVCQKFDYFLDGVFNDPDDWDYDKELPDGSEDY